MYELKAYAIRRNGVVLVKLTGLLPDSCHEAHVVDQYPGGKIVYLRDPEEVQIFLSESIRPAADFCVFPLVPWTAEVRIPDQHRHVVGVYVNGDKVVAAEIRSHPTRFQVIALVGHEKPTGCSVIPSDAYFPMIYQRVYGPAPKAKCEEWVVDNCSGLPVFG